MSIERRNFPQFFITAPAPCPYLAGKFERKVFTHLLNSDAQQLHDTLSQGGFRRSQNIAYRPACEGCASCISVRIPVAGFHWTRGFRRVLKANQDLSVCVEPAKATSEHYSLFRYYIDQRHGEGGMVDMSVLDFTAMVEESYVRTQLVEYRLPTTARSGREPERGELVATALTDVLDDGLSMIYSFYDPDCIARSLGTFMILDHIDRARCLGMSYVYLGYWVSGSDKMSYKARFLPQERLLRDGWTLFE